MQKQTLGNSDFEITRIGLGTWAIGGPWEWGWGSQDDRESIKTIHEALERGINWIDTAPVYGLGHSEEVVAEALRTTSHKPYVFTKCGLPWDENRKESNVLKRASIEKEVDDSLRRLAVDVIDLYQIHWPVPEEDIEEAWTTLAELKEKGKVRYIGVSNFSVEQMQRVRPIAKITSLQPAYSLAFPEVKDEILPYCHRNKIGVINYSPMASGLLSGKMTRETVDALPADDWRRKYGDQFQEPRLTRNLRLVELLKEIGSAHDCTAGEVAIAWTLLHPAVTGAIVGMRRPEQVNGVIRAGELRLTDEEIQAEFSSDQEAMEEDEETDEV
ncbi:aldo/keto reductase, partial [bacterium]|nr:aldo/keto reductase [bacterium]